jgi:hypothetical protein
MPVTEHCQSVGAGTLVLGQYPPNRCTSGTVTTSDTTGGTGHRRGVICFLHPSQPSDFALPLNMSTPPWDGFGAMTALIANAGSDGWVLDYPAMPVDWSVSAVSYFTSVLNQTSADTTHGQILVNSIVEWWDHYVLYVASRYGTDTNNKGRPIIVAGFSWGAWVAMQVLLNRSSTVVGSFMHCLPTLWGNIPDSFFGYTPGTMAGINWTAMNVGTTALNAVSVPSVIGYGSSDGVVGWGTAGAGTCPTNFNLTSGTCTNGVNTATINVTSTANVRLGQIVTGFGITGTFSVQSFVLNTSVTLTSLSGNTPTTASGHSYLFAYGGPASNTDQIIANAQGAGQPCSRYSGQPVQVAWPDGHLMGGAGGDAATYISPSGHSGSMPTPQSWSSTLGWVQAVMDPLYAVTF